MHKLLFALLAVLVAFSASAREYGNHDPKRLLTVSETPSGKKYGFDGAYLDQMLNDLSAHAKNYPPQFDTQEDKQRAIRDVRTLSGMLDILINVPDPNPELLFRAAYLNSMGHNLDIPGAAEKADSIFLKLLAAKPSDPRGNYAYGAFLVGAGKSKEALPYLEKALSLGVVDAAYAIGMTHLALGDKARAMKSFEDYKRRNPKDGNVDTLIEGIRSGKIEVRKNPG
ncbi:MAG: hypothetical protein LBM17_02940 [Candidatus Accumulibacter sp.]|jgi:tetratricopeptide (TPR) repeat protein|nr:hypothetical protein [Accumulibacter sp.]